MLCLKKKRATRLHPTKVVLYKERRGDPFARKSIISYSSSSKRSAIP